MIGKTARERAANLGLDLGSFKTERDLRVAIRRAQREYRVIRPCCELVNTEMWCPVHGDLLK